MLNRLKRFFALVLTVLMFINMLPMSALADEMQNMSATWSLAATYASSNTNSDITMTKTTMWIEDSTTLTGTSANGSHTWGSSREGLVSNNTDLYTKITTSSKNANQMTIQAKKLGTFTVIHSYTAAEKSDDKHDPKDNNQQNSTSTYANTFNVVVYGAILDSMRAMYPGETQLISYTKNLPSDVTGTWFSEDSDIATVDSNGVVTGVAKGTTYIYYTVTYEGKTHTYKTPITIKTTHDVSVTPSEITMITGDTANAQVATTGNYSDITWTSSNTSVATVESNNETGALSITGVSAGKTAIIGLTESGEVLLVNVTVQDVGISVVPVNVSMVGGDVFYVYPEIVAKEGYTLGITSSDSVISAVENADGSVALNAQSVTAETNVTVTLTLTSGSVTKTASVNVIVMPKASDTTYYTVSFYDYHGNLLRTQSVQKDAEVSVPTQAEVEAVQGAIEGHSYQGFDVAGTEEVEKIKDKVQVSSDHMLLFAKYAINTYTVTFDAKIFSATAPAAQTVTHGASATKPDDLGNVGDYTFKYWYLESEDEEYDFSTPVTSNITLKAKWVDRTINVYLLTYKGVYAKYVYNYVSRKWTKNGEAYNDTSITLPCFNSKDREYYSYTYTNTVTDKGKTAYYQFWVDGQTASTYAANNDATVKLDSLKKDGVDRYFTAIYEPGANNSQQTEANGYHVNTANITVQLVDEDGIILGETVLNAVPVTPALGNTTLVSQYAKYPYITSENVTSTTAKFGYISVDDILGRTVTIDGIKYTVTSADDVDNSALHVVWLCTQDNHVYGGVCKGGTWNALGVIKLTARKVQSSNSASLRVNYYQVDKENWVTANKTYLRSVTRSTELKTLAIGDVLVHNLYEEGVLSTDLVCVGYQWEVGSDGTKVAGGNSYVLNLYYYAKPYKATFNYYVQDETGSHEHNSKKYIKQDESFTVENLLNGYTYTAASPTYPGYVLEDSKQAVVSIAINRADVVVNVYYKPETISINGEKIWDDNDNANHNRPDSITVNLLADDVQKETATVTAADNWKYSFTDLPKYKDGKEISYTVTEDAVTGYTTAINAYTITNKLETTSVSGSKTWDDNNNQDGKRPDSITVRLYADGVDTGKTETANAASDWKYSFEGLPKYANGKEIVYTVTEDAVTGYATAVDGYDITNTHTPETITINGTKTWDDANNQDGKRPTSITVTLTGTIDKETVSSDSKTVSASDGWKYSFTDLPKYKDGKEITYSVAEEDVDGYTATVNGYNITNSHTPATTTINGTKTWNDADNQDGKRPDSITVHLYANGVEVANKEVTANDNWSYSFTGMPVNANGKAITYTVSEDKVDGYTATVNGYNITNSHTPATTTISGTKTWNDADNQDGKRPTSITVKLLANGEDTGKTETANAASDWKYSFTDLPEYEEGKVGAKITYSVTEEAVEGYEAAYKATKDGFDITNTHEIETITISGTKIWNDADNQDGKRPDSITVRLYADGTEVKTATIEANADGNWMYSFTNLPKYKEGENGREIVYTITEDAVKGYTTKVEGYSITNTRMVGHLTVEKTTTSTPKNGKTYALGEKIEYKIVVKNDGNQTITNIAVTDELTGDTWTIESLAPGESSKAFTAEHVVTEEDIRKGKVVNVATATGTSPDPYNPKVPVEPGTTEDPTDEFNPAYTVVKVLAEQPKNGKFFELGETAKFTITVTNTGNVTLKSITVKEELAGATFENGTAQVTIDSLKPGAKTTLKAQYTITEADLGNKDLKNMLTSSATTPNPDPEKPDVPVEPDPIVPVPIPVDDVKSVSGKKIWEDSNNKDGVRPESITVNLLADGEKIKTATVKADANGDWSYSFERLPMHKDGREIVYTITEDAVKGYTTKVEGYSITNTRMVGHLTVEKTTTSTPKNGKTYALGEKIKYEIVVKNDGNQTITNIAVTDELTGDTWTIESLAPGESSKAFTAEHVVTEEDIRKGKVVNVATATGISPDPYNPEVPVDPGTKEDPTDEFNPAYTVVKVLAEQPKNGKFFELGETAKFTITVSNTGNVTLKNITVKEELAGATFENGTAQATIDSLKPGATTMLKAQYTITEADLGNEDLKNMLTSSATTPNPDPEKPDVPVDPDPIIPVPIPVDDARYTLTIRYWYERIGGKVAAETFTRSYRLKDSYSVTSPKLRGYSVDQDVVSGEITGDMQFDVIYTPNEYRVVIKYVYEDGTPAAPSYRDTVRNGDKYDVKSPTLDGYTPSKKRVTGVINGRDVVYTVIYVPTTTIIDDYGVPLNIGSVTMNAGDCFE